MKKKANTSVAAAWQIWKNENDFSQILNLIHGLVLSNSVDILSNLRVWAVYILRIDHTIVSFSSFSSERKKMGKRMEVSGREEERGTHTHNDGNQRTDSQIPTYLLKDLSLIHSSRREEPLKLWLHVFFFSTSVLRWQNYCNHNETVRPSRTDSWVHEKTDSFCFNQMVSKKDRGGCTKSD